MSDITSQKLPVKLPEKPKAGLYVDDSNLYHRGKEAGWKVDYKKLYNWVAKRNIIVYAKYFIGMPAWEPAKTINKGLAEYYEKIGYEVIKKPLKRIKDAGRNKCNFDVEMHEEIRKDLAEVDIIYLASGDSDFMATKAAVLKAGKRIKFMAFKNNCAWEIRESWHIFLDDIREQVERGPVYSAEVGVEK